MYLATNVHCLRQVDTIYLTPNLKRFGIIPSLGRFATMDPRSKSSSKSKSIAMRISIWIMSKSFRPF